MKALHSIASTLKASRLVAMFASMSPDPIALHAAKEGLRKPLTFAGAGVKDTSITPTRCVCKHNGQLPKWCPKHRAYVVNGERDR